MVVIEELDADGNVENAHDHSPKDAGPDEDDDDEEDDDDDDDAVCHAFILTGFHPVGCAGFVHVAARELNV